MTQEDFTKDEQNIMNHETNLRLFINHATKFPIKFIYSTVRQEDYPYSISFQDLYIMNAKPLFERFKNSLRKELSNYNKETRDVYLTDLKDRFIPMQEHYKKWYNKHKAETAKFNPYNPYELMFELILSTEKEIYKYEPGQKNISNTATIDSESLQDKNLKFFEFPPIPDGILKQPGIEKLLEIEKSLIEKGSLMDELGRWIGNSDDLADLLWAFKVKNYFESKTEKFTKSEREFFKERYKCKKQVEQYLYPSKKVRFNVNQFNIYWE